jgi:hypothetical protein
MSGTAAMTIAACVAGLVLGAYDDLIAKGGITDLGRDTAWRDFNAQQIENERDRLRWEEAADE